MLPICSISQLLGLALSSLISLVQGNVFKRFPSPDCRGKFELPNGRLSDIFGTITYNKNIPMHTNKYQLLLDVNN